MSKPCMAAVLITPEPLPEKVESFIPNAEVATVLCCGECGDPVASLSEGLLVIDLDPNEYPRTPVGNDLEGNFLYLFSGAVKFIHKRCDNGSPGIRVSAFDWALGNGRIGFKPRFSRSSMEGKEDKKSVN